METKNKQFPTQKEINKVKEEDSPITELEKRMEKVCEYCGGSGYDSYPNHDTTMAPCPECDGTGKIKQTKQ